MATTSPNPNVEIFDEAVALIESTSRQEKQLLSGETMSYREYNKGQPHVLVMLPGYVGNDTWFSVLATLPEFQDHHIIAVNPIGWNGSSMNAPATTKSHEANANEVMELLNLLGIEKAMCSGYSTGGGIAFWMAHNYPKIISAAFLMHSIPLNGFHFYDEIGKPLDSEILGEQSALPWNDRNMSTGAYVELMKPYSTDPSGFPPIGHKLYSYLMDGMDMPGIKEVMVANMKFNATPIKTPWSEPSDALATLQSKVIVVHDKKDVLVNGDHVVPLTKLALVENWAPKGMLHYYESNVGHMILLDSPRAFAAIHRKAFEEQVLAPKEGYSEVRGK